MNKRGFLFIEAIITTVVLLSVVVIIYSGYNSSIIEEKNRLYYDDISFVYKAIDMSNSFDYDKDNAYLDESTDFCFEINDNDIDSSLKDDYLIDNVYFIEDALKLKKTLKDSSNHYCGSFLNSLNDDDLKQYLNTINPNPKVSSEIIVVKSHQTKSGKQCDNIDYKACKASGKSEMDCQCVTYYAWAYYYDNGV